VKGLNSNVHHQLITSPAALSGLLTLSVNVSERPSLIITVPLQGTPKVFAKAGQDVETSAAVQFQLLFGQDGFNLIFVINLYFCFSISLWFRAEPATNSLPFGNAKR